MPSKRIPCTDCASETEELEELGKTVLSCEAILNEPGWCEITWTDRTRRTTRNVSPRAKAAVRERTAKRKVPKVAKPRRSKKSKVKRKKS